jgi:hypothetical protein
MISIIMQPYYLILFVLQKFLDRTQVKLEIQANGL